jgi:hypothetical protein
MKERGEKEGDGLKNRFCNTVQNVGKFKLIDMRKAFTVHAGYDQIHVALFKSQKYFSGLSHFLQNVL